MSVKIKSTKNKMSLTISGEMTIYTAQEYINKIQDKLSADKDLEIDLAGVEEIDTSGLQILTTLSKELDSNGSKLNILAMSDVVNEALEMSCLMSNVNGTNTEN